MSKVIPTLSLFIILINHTRTMEEEKNIVINQSMIFLQDKGKEQSARMTSFALGFARSSRTFATLVCLTFQLG